jgi:hypothetical protein
MHYTAIVKHASFISFISVIFFAVIACFFVVSEQRETNIARLLASPAIADQLDGIDMANGKPFDNLVVMFEKILNEQNDASARAQEVLVATAFSEQRVGDLSSSQIRTELLEAVIWWSEDHEKTTRFASSNEVLIPSLHQLAWLTGIEEPPSLDVLFETPVQDRDGSVVLGALAIEKFTTKQKRTSLIRQWTKDYDFARQKTAVLLAMMADQSFDFPPSQRQELSTLQAIQKDKHYLLAWRALHDEDGMIIPDIALAGMLANEEKFFPILLESVEENKWNHPEHAILIASRFAPEVASKLPFNFLQNSETRKKWWSLFTCGLLLERR